MKPEKPETTEETSTDNLNKDFSEETEEDWEFKQQARRLAEEMVRNLNRNVLAEDEEESQSVDGSGWSSEPNPPATLISEGLMEKKIKADSSASHQAGLIDEEQVRLVQRLIRASKRQEKNPRKHQKAIKIKGVM